MRKRILSTLLALCLALSLLPASALATGGEETESPSDNSQTNATIRVGGVELMGSEGTPAYATTDGDGAVTALTAAPIGDNWNIMWDGETLTLNGATIAAGHQFTYQTVWDYSISGSAAIYYEGGSDINIALEGNNTVTGPSTETGSETAGGSYGIFACAPLPSSLDDLIDLTISGDGTLEVAGGAAYPGEGSCGIYADQLVIDSGTVQAAGGPVQEKQIGENTFVFGESYGIYTLGGVTINDGTVTAAGGERETGTSTSSYGIQAYGPITINGGTVTARGSTLALDIYSGDGFFVQVNPPENKAIAVTSSNSIDGNNAEAIDGSPFNNNTNITEYIKDYTRYIHSEVRDLSSPDPNPPTNHEIYVGGVGLTGTAGMPAYATTNDSGTVTTQDASADNYNIKWDGETLTLKGATITQGSHENAAIYYDEATDLEIVLEEDNTVTGPDVSLGGDSSSYGIHVYAVDAEVTLTISGSGSLTATGGDATPNSGGKSYGIYTWGDAIITSGTVTATGGAAKFQSHGIYARHNVTISGGAVKATGGSVTEGSDGSDAGSGIHADVVTISGGTVNATGGAVTSSGNNTTSCGIYGSSLYGGVIISGGTVTATGGTFTSAGTTANVESYGIYTPNSGIKISGGTVTATGGNGALGRGVYLDPEGTSIAVTAGQDADSATEIIGSPFVWEEDLTDLVSGAKYFHSESQELEGDIYVGGVGLTSTEATPTYAKTDEYGTVSTEGATADNYNIKWDGETLTLKGATITQDAWRGAAIWYCRDSDLNIALVGTNTVTGPSGSGSGASYGIFAWDPNELIDLTISGDGSLTVTGGGTVSESCGIYTDNLIVQSGTGTVNATGGDGAEDSYGIYAYDVTISGGDVTATGGTVNATSEDGAEDSFGIYAANDFTISGGAVTATGGDSEEDSFGIYADNDFTISGGAVNATGGDGVEDSYGINAYDVTISGGDVTATGGTVNATSEDGAEDSFGIYAANDFTISGGAVTATGGDSAEDSYGIYADYVTITGGTVTAEGGTAGEKSAGIDIVALTISGGTITATGNTSGVYGSSKECKITIAPQTDQQIAVLLGESETAAAAIAGSPFASETEITSQVNNSGKYFHSEVVGITPPEPEEFTITFDAAGGTTPASQTTVDGKLTSLPTSTRDGYDFLGWYTAGGDRVTTDTVFAADTTLYARWAEQAGPGDDDKPPYIPPQPTGPNTGNSEGWDDIQEEIGQAQPGDTITIDMNGETEVPAEMFEEVAGKDVTVELDLGGGITWTVNGQDVPTDTSLSDLDLGVDLGTNGISADVINTVTGAYGTVQMTLAHDGAFGFTLTLTAPLGRENAGYWANLYHYDEEAEALTFETSAQIADDGSVALRMSHASQYAIVIDDKNHGENAGQPTLNTQDHDAYLLGYEDGTVRPEGSITRAEVATIFFRLLTDESRDKFWSQTNDYTDVPADAWYNNAVSTLSNAGILDGYEDGTVRPDGNITRAEFATITARFLEASYDGGNRFPDIDGHWAAEYINEAANAGIVDGYEDGTFRPQQNITRAEAVTMVNRTVDRHPDADYLLDNMVTWPDNPESAWYYAQIQEATNAHAYTMHTDQEDAPYEIWTELLPNRDWSALEQAWSDAHAGGEHATA